MSKQEPINRRPSRPHSHCSSFSTYHSGADDHEVMKSQSESDKAVNCSWTIMQRVTAADNLEHSTLAIARSALNAFNNPSMLRRLRPRRFGRLLLNNPFSPHKTKSAAAALSLT